MERGKGLWEPDGTAPVGITSAVRGSAGQAIILYTNGNTPRSKRWEDFGLTLIYTRTYQGKPLAA